MSSDCYWTQIIREFVAIGIPIAPDLTGDPEPWMGYAGVSRLTGLKVSTVKVKCSGVRRHDVWEGFVKYSEVEQKLRKEKSDGEKTKKKKG